MIKHYASMLLSPCKVWNLSLNAPIFPIFFLFNHFRKKIFWLQFKCIFLFCHQSLCSCTKIAHDHGWSCIKTLDLSKHSNDQFELQPRHTFSDNMCPRRHFQGDLIYLCYTESLSFSFSPPPGWQDLLKNEEILTQQQSKRRTSQHEGINS